MRILQMHRNLGAGGIEALVFHLSNALAKEHDVTVCTINTPSTADHFFARLDPHIKKETIGMTPGNNPLGTVIKIFRYIRKGHFDIVQLHGFFYFYSLAIILLHKRTHFFYTVHSDASKENNPWDIRLFRLKRFCFRKKWMTPITISHASQESFRNLYGCGSEMIYNGIEKPETGNGVRLREAFHLLPSTKVFIHPGRLSREKNQIWLCRIFDRLVREGNDVALILAGPAHFQQVLEEISPFFSDRIMYVGERSDIPALMAQCLGMCLCSQYEGMPIVLLEALATGCVPVCTPVGGIVNVIKDGVNGVLSTEVSEESYYQALKGFLASCDRPDWLQGIKENCRQSFAGFDIRITSKQYEECYKKTLLRTQ